MKPSYFKSLLFVLSISIFFSCKNDEVIIIEESEIKLEGNWEQVTETSTGSETLVFIFNEDISFTSYTETCESNDCEIAYGQDANWYLDEDIITVNFIGINISNTYTITTLTNTELVLEYGNTILNFTKKED